MDRRKDFLKATIVTFGIPVALLVLLTQVLSSGWGPVVVFLAFLLVYLSWAFSGVSYDSKTIRGVMIPAAPERIADLLRTTTSRGELIIVNLLSSFRNHEKLSQTEMTEYAQRHGIELTAQRIRDYIKIMESSGLITSPETRYEKEYRLTKEGMWCRKAVQQCFPSKVILFHLRNGLGLVKLGPFPERTQKDDQCPTKDNRLE